jgi:hypothetical protein
MALGDDYYIERITYKMAMEIVIANHYLHRKAPCSVAFGLFDRSTHLCFGVVTYGVSASSTLLKGICGVEQAQNVYELTRLWVDDSVPKNGESFLIGNTIKQLDKEIIVSYADSSQDHLGIVYQATNFIYTGMSDRHVEWRLDGKSGTHSRHVFDEYGGVNGAKDFFGDRLEKHERPRKHRYIYFNATKKKKKELLSLLRYKVLPYPKIAESE